MASAEVVGADGPISPISDLFSPGGDLSRVGDLRAGSCQPCVHKAAWSAMQHREGFAGSRELKCMSMGCDTAGTSYCDPTGWKVRLGWCQTVPVQRGRVVGGAGMSSILSVHYQEAACEKLKSREAAAALDFLDDPDTIATERKGISSDTRRLLTIASWPLRELTRQLSCTCVQSLGVGKRSHSIHQGHAAHGKQTRTTARDSNPPPSTTPTSIARCLLVMPPRRIASR